METKDETKEEGETSFDAAIRIVGQAFEITKAQGFTEEQAAVDFTRLIVDTTLNIETQKRNANMAQVAENLMSISTAFGAGMEADPALTQALAKK